MVATFALSFPAVHVDSSDASSRLLLPPGVVAVVAVSAAVAVVSHNFWVGSIDTSAKCMGNL